MGNNSCTYSLKCVFELIPRRMGLSPEKRREERVVSFFSA